MLDKIDASWAVSLKITSTINGKLGIAYILHTNQRFTHGTHVKNTSYILFTHDVISLYVRVDYAVLCRKLV